MNQDHHQLRDSEQMHHIIKREMQSEYDEIDQEQTTENMAEDLTITSDHTDSNILDA